MSRQSPSQQRLRKLAGLITEAVGQRMQQIHPGMGSASFFRILVNAGQEGGLVPVEQISFQDAQNAVKNGSFYDKGNGVFDSDDAMIVAGADWQAAKQAVAAVYGDFAEQLQDPQGGGQVDGAGAPMEAGSVYYMIQGGEDGAPVTSQKFTDADQFFQMIRKLGAEETDSSYVYEKPGMDVVFVWGNNQAQAKEELISVFGDWVETPGMPF